MAQRVGEAKAVERRPQQTPLNRKTEMDSAGGGNHEGELRWRRIQVKKILIFLLEPRETWHRKTLGN